MQKTAAADMVIVGGGIAGLWLLNRLRRAGFSVFLFESGALGGGQTHKSQGIIHGGMKYALQGRLTKDMQALAEMPKRWQQCLAGSGEMDLSNVPLLSAQHFLWASHKFTSKLMGFIASTALTGKVEPLARENYPAVFQHNDFKGDVFSLDEIVVDVPILIRELVKANQDAIFHIEPICSDGLKLNEKGELVTATVYMSGKSIEVSAQQFIFTAGAGNEVIINKLKQKNIAMQRRPLHMVLVKLPFDASLYAHCLGLGSRPRITITTHMLQNGRKVWYLGGMLAEEGIHRDSAAQIHAAKEELQTLFPWLDFSGAEFATFMIDRAEQLQGNGFKPETACMKIVKNTLVAWPTKLALAPKLADDVMRHFQQLSLTPQLFDVRELRSWPIPPLAKPVWEDVFCCSNVF
ncbi:MAG: FAD-dependent oxidoreductase [Gammaproteobacteria bacterium]|nr:FAD-dependent oxidoreductase [Gammaproteobacteria bacterium]